MVPWERDIFITMLAQHLRDEAEKQKQLDKARGIFHD